MLYDNFKTITKQNAPNMAMEYIGSKKWQKKYWIISFQKNPKRIRIEMAIRIGKRALKIVQIARKRNPWKFRNTHLASPSSSSDEKIPKPVSSTSSQRFPILFSKMKKIWRNVRFIIWLCIFFVRKTIFFGCAFFSRFVLEKRKKKEKKMELLGGREKNKRIEKCF